MSKEPQRQIDDCNVICPYCGHEYQPEPCDYADYEIEENCEECGNTFARWTEFTVTHRTRPLAKGGEV